jgi:hypothetical protein
MRPAWWLLMLLVSLVAPVVARQLALEDFSTGFYLEVDGKGAIYTVELPEMVYRTVTRKDLGDIRVFNGAGEVVPHSIRIAPGGEAGDEAWQPLPLFPLYGRNVGGLNDLSVQVRRRENGSILEVRSHAVEGRERDQPDSYLLDAGEFSGPLAELDFQWPANITDALVTVSIEGSSDLLHWRTIVARATLAGLRFNGELIRQSRVALPGRGKERYLRLRWLNGSRGIPLTSAAGRKIEGAGSRSLRWLSADSLTETLEEGRPELVFKLDHLLPFSGIRVGFPDSNSFAAMALYSKGEEGPEWQERCRKNFYQLRVDEVQLVEDTCLFPGVDHPLWRLVVTSEGATLGEGAGQLSVKFGYRPHELAFVARGNPPFLLAFGSGLLKGAELQPPPDILRGASKDASAGSLIKKAVVGKSVTLGGSEALIAPDPPLPWKRWLLWFILAAGVVLLAWMAWSLTRDMRISRE